MDTRAEQTDGFYERRKHPRLKVMALGVTITVRATLGGEPGTAQLINVSLGGCCITLPAARARTLHDYGAAVCALPVGVADAPRDCAATVVAWRGEDAEPEHFVHLCFSSLTLHARILLMRWITNLKGAWDWHCSPACSAA